jgi:ADP-ribose pyrophosphatase
MKLRGIEIVEDRTASSRCDEGFLRLRRLVVRNVYEDGRSEPYACDVVSRAFTDAVVAVLYERRGGRVAVLLRESPRAPAYLRRFKQLEHPDDREYLTLAEVVAGLLEAGDGADEEGLRRRASAEALEEAGCACTPQDFAALGGPTFASPGTSDEKVFYCAGEVRLAERREPSGDGSVMEESARLLVLDLREAIEICRRGDIPDMKTELALLRLADHLGYLPQLDCFVEDLPEALRRRYSRLGLAGVEPEKRQPGLDITRTGGA